MNPIDPADCYYGSTIHTINRRYSQHQASYKQFKQGNVKYKNIMVYALFDKYGPNNCLIELVEDYPCEDKYQLRQKEGEYIRQIGTLNKNIAERTKLEYSNEYYQTNKNK